jgi:hypothetical protein
MRRTPFRRRRAPAKSHVPFTRYPGKGYQQQIRWPLPGNISVNCGLYDPALAAVVRKKLLAEVRKYPRTPLGVWQALTVVLDRLKAAGVDVPEVMPKYVKARPDGGFAASVRKGGRFLEVPGPYERPEEAHEAMVALLTREFPPAVKETAEPVPEMGELVTLLDYYRPAKRAVSAARGRAPRSRAA